MWHPDSMLVGDSVTSRLDAGGWHCDTPTRFWWVTVWHPDSKLVGDSVTSRYDAGGWQCDIPTRSWWVTVWHPDSMLVGDSVTSRHDSGGWQCDIPTRCWWVLRVGNMSSCDSGRHDSWMLTLFVHVAYTVSKCVQKAQVTYTVLPVCSQRAHVFYIVSWNLFTKGPHIYK